MIAGINVSITAVLFPAHRYAFFRKIQLHRMHRVLFTKVCLEPFARAAPGAPPCAYILIQRKFYTVPLLYTGGCCLFVVRKQHIAGQQAARLKSAGWYNIRIIGKILIAIQDSILIQAGGK